MKLSNILGVVAFASAVAADSVSYDKGYDDGSRSMTAVSCSNGTNGIVTQYGWQKQSDIPNFPYIGGVPAIRGWNSSSCGTCWKLTYNSRSIQVLGVDQGHGGFNIALAAMQELTNGHAIELGRVNALATQVPLSNCKITQPQ